MKFSATTFQARVLLTIGLLGWSPAVLAATTVFSHETILESCVDDYRDGVDRASELLRDAAPSLDGLNDDASAIESEECRYFFSIGAFDAVHLFQQQVMVEYLLERRVSGAARVSGPRWASIRGLYENRLRLAFAEEGTLARLEEPAFERVTEEMIARLRVIAAESGKPVPMGRFLIAPAAHIPVMTAFEYGFESDGSIADHSGSTRVGRGTFQKAAESLARRVEDTAKRYVAWNPALFFGEDSWWYGSLWRAFDQSATSKRAEIQDGFDREMRNHLRFARQMGIDPRPITDLYRMMMNRERAMLERETETYRRTMVALCAAPLIPVGMYVGATGLATVGFKSLVAGTGSFAYVGGSLGYAANASAMMSLASIAGFTGVSAFGTIRDVIAHPGEVSAADAMDRIVGASLMSFPMAAALPAVVGQSAATVKTAYVSGKALIASGGDLLTTVRGLGWRAGAGEAARLPMRFARWWGTSWWSNKILIVQQLADFTVGVGLEIGTREIMGGDQAFFLSDGKGGTRINPDAMLNIAQVTVLSIVGRPLVTIHNPAGRYLAFGTFGIASSLVTQLAIKGSIDWERVAFEQAYGSTIGTVQSEVSQMVANSSFMSQRGALTQFFLITLWRTAVRAPLTQAKQYLLKRYIGDDESLPDDVVAMVREATRVDLSAFDDAEIEESIRLVLSDPDFLAELGEVVTN